MNEFIEIVDYFNVSIDYLLERANNANIQKQSVKFTNYFIA